VEIDPAGEPGWIASAKMTPVVKTVALTAGMVALVLMTASMVPLVRLPLVTL
jgi:hypothetical protein